jgi:hypothetical protein
MLDAVIPKIAASDGSPKYDVIVARKHNPQTSHNQGMSRFSYSTGKTGMGEDLFKLGVH